MATRDERVLQLERAVRGVRCSPCFKWYPYLTEKASGACHERRACIYLPPCVPRADAEAEGAGKVKPETLPELSSDGCDGHTRRGGWCKTVSWVLRLGASAARGMSGGRVCETKYVQIISETRLIEPHSRVSVPALSHIMLHHLSLCSYLRGQRVLVRVTCGRAGRIISRLNHFQVLVF